MRRVLAALVVTAVAVVLLAGFESRPPRMYNPNSALRAEAGARPALAARPVPVPDQPVMRSGTRAGSPGTRSGKGPLLVTPFSAIQVRAVLTGGRLTGVETILLTGDGPHTDALNARAEPILREEALRAGSADIDVVSGATYTSQSWIGSLQAAIEDAAKGRRRG